MSYENNSTRDYMKITLSNYSSTKVSMHTLDLLNFERDEIIKKNIDENLRKIIKDIEEGRNYKENLKQHLQNVI